MVSPLRAMNIKSALRDLLSVPYGMISILVISRYAAPPYPAVPDFPPSGGQNKTPRDNLLINPPLEMTVLADTPPSFRPKRSEVEKSPPSDGTGNIRAGDLSTQSIIGAVTVCLSYRHAAPLEMTVVASALRHFDRSEAEWRNLTPPWYLKHWSGRSLDSEHHGSVFHLPHTDMQLRSR